MLKASSPDCIDQKPKLSISFSGGRSSAVMTKLCLEKYGGTHEIVVTFANTGCEHPATLDFVRDCDTHWHFNTIWLEAVVGPKGMGIRHRIVNYDSASRNGEPFEAFIKKYGIPNPGNPQCTSRLKTEVMESYLKYYLGWNTTLGKRNYKTAVGIRADEIDRISAKADDYQFIYPLVDDGWNKDRVNAFMRHQYWDLKLPNDAYGNCVWCWKKSLRKLMTVAKENPSAFDFPKEMEEKYSHHKARDGQRLFFRGNNSANNILNMANTTKFIPYTDTGQLSIWDESLDMGGSCSDGCEIGHD